WRSARTSEFSYAHGTARAIQELRSAALFRLMTINRWNGDVMKTTAPKSNAGSIVPAVHLEFIQNELENPDASSSEQVEQYHRALFLHHHAVEWEKYRQQAKTYEDRLAFLEG